MCGSKINDGFTKNILRIFIKGFLPNSGSFLI
jgi:hypothetical protein